MNDYRLIGTNQTPKDLRAKITGRAKYSEDFRADGMLFTKLLLSPVPRGRVTRLNVDGALAMEGVHAVVTADDFPDPGGNEPVLTNEPRYQGQPIAAVAAVDETTAANAVEALDLRIQPLEFVLDPLETLRPGGPNPTEAGNAYWEGDVAEVKWSSQDMLRLEGQAFPPDDFPRVDGWEFGDLNGGFEQSSLIIEEPIVHQSQSHHPLEPRTAMAYWQNGRLYLHCSVQSTAQARSAHAASLQMDEADLVIIAEYCGGGFGSKVFGTVTDIIPAVLARRAGRPVMMRVTRDEETYFGRARAGLQGWAKLGFRSDGRLLALDLLLVQDSGCYGLRSDLAAAGSYSSLVYQPEAMRFRGIPVITNTPPRGAQRAPGAAQAMTMLGPLMSRAARELDVDELDLMDLNAPPEDAEFYPGPVRVTSAYVREAIRLGRERFRWDEKRQLSGRVEGSRVTGVAAALSSYSAGVTGYDGMLIIRPDGRLTVHSGVGNLGTHSVFDTCMAAAEVLRVPWDEVELVWGDSSRGLPWSAIQAGSRTTHAHTRANWAAGHDAKQKLQEIAALDLGGSPDEYDVDGQRVFRSNDPSLGLSFAQAAQRAIDLGGRYDGSELSEELHGMTVASVREHLMGQGLVGAATDTYSHEGESRSTVISFAVVEVDRETGMVDVLELLSVADCGTVLHPRSLAAQVHGGVLQGMSQARFERWAFDPRWGVNSNKRLYTAKPITILDVPQEFDFVAVDIPDPQTPVGSRGIGEPPVGAGAAVVLSAVYDALGIYVNRTPITPDKILNALEGGDSGYRSLQTHV